MQTVYIVWYHYYDDYPDNVGLYASLEVAQEAAEHVIKDDDRQNYVRDNDAILPTWNSVELYDGESPEARIWIEPCVVQTDAFSSNPPDLSRDDAHETD